MNTFFERHSSLIAWLGGLGIPIALIAAGWLISTNTESSKLESEYVRMALSILTAQDRVSDGKRPPLTNEEIALRQWAVRLLNRQSPEKFTEEEQKALLTVRNPFGSLSVEDQETATILLGVYRYFTKTLNEKTTKNPSPTASPQ
jgi:hypothetical protein